MLTQLTPDEQALETDIFEYSGSGDVSGPVDPDERPRHPGHAGAQQHIGLRGRATSRLHRPSRRSRSSSAVRARSRSRPTTPRPPATTRSSSSTRATPVAPTCRRHARALRRTSRSSGSPTPMRSPSSRTSRRAAPRPGSPRRSRSTWSARRRTSSPTCRKTKTAHNDQVVVVGAHLDSVVEGPGINDNGSGSSTILEIAEQMSALKLTKKLQRPVRFAFWGAEESGLLGSEHYVANLSDRPAVEDLRQPELRHAGLAELRAVRLRR